MIWDCFEATGHDQLAVTESTMNSAVYQSILEFDVRPSVMAKARIELGQENYQNRLTGKKQNNPGVATVQATKVLQWEGRL